MLGEQHDGEVQRHGFYYWRRPHRCVEERTLTSTSSDELTVDSIWHAMTGVPMTDDFLAWPPDVFAVTDVILKRSEAYRFILSKRADMKWPPSRVQNWTDVIDEAARAWSEGVEVPERGLPTLVREEWSVLLECAGTSLERLAEGHDWRMCEALLTLH